MGLAKPTPFRLSSSKHHKKGDFVAVLNGSSEFIWVGSRIIHKNLNDIEQLVFVGK